MMEEPIKSMWKLEPMKSIWEAVRYSDYKCPYGIEDIEYRKLMCQLILLVRLNGFTTNEAQQCFVDCSDALLNLKL